MKKFDYLSLDGRALTMLKLIHSHGSVTQAANDLGVTQSTVSHALDRMRNQLDDPLFLKVGRSMVATERMDAMVEDIDRILENLQALGHHVAFDPAKAEERFSIVCNDFEHDLLVPAIFRHMQKEAPHCSLRTYQNHVLDFDCLNKGIVDLTLRPYPPQDSSDLVVAPLCADHMVTFYDPNMRDAPKSIEDFATSRHAILSLGSDERTAVDAALAEQGMDRHVAYLGPNFSAISMVVRNSDMLATAPSRLATSIFSDLAWVEAPVMLDRLDFYMIWHVRNRHSPRHLWFREMVKRVARELPSKSAVCDQVLAKYGADVVKAYEKEQAERKNAAHSKTNAQH